MTGFSWATHMRLGRKFNSDTLGDRIEGAWAAHVEAKTVQDGHGDCTGWQYVKEEARVICSCGEVIASEGKWGAKDAS